MKGFMRYETFLRKILILNLLNKNDDYKTKCKMKTKDQ